MRLFGYYLQHSGDGAKKKAHDPTTQIGRLLKNAISVIIVGRKKSFRHTTPLIKRQEKNVLNLLSPLKNPFNFHIVSDISNLFFIGNDFLKHKF